MVTGLAWSSPAQWRHISQLQHSERLLERCENTVVVVPYYDRPSALEALLRALADQTVGIRAIYVVTHGARDIRPVVPPGLKVTWIRGSPDEWWSASVNRGIAAALSIAPPADHVLLLNDDVTFDSTYLEELHSVAKLHPDALVGSALKEAPDKLDLDGLHLLDLMRCSFFAGFLDPKMHTAAADGLSGRGMLVPVQAIREVGPIHERRFPHYLADLDFSRRAWEHGWRLLVAVRAVVNSAPAPVGPQESLWARHFSRRSTTNIRDHLIFFASHGPWYLRMSAWLRVPLMFTFRQIRRMFRT